MTESADEDEEEDFDVDMPHLNNINISTDSGVLGGYLLNIKIFLEHHGHLELALNAIYSELATCHAMTPSQETFHQLYCIIENIHC